MSHVCASPHGVVQVEVAKQYLLLGLIVVQYCTYVCQHGAVALTASSRIVDVVYSKVLSLPLIVVCNAVCNSAVIAAYRLYADGLTLSSMGHVSQHDPCLQCGANFVATAFEGKAQSLSTVSDRDIA
jgi:hypothetical protein